jgi:hypothetical protein
MPLIPSATTDRARSVLAAAQKIAVDRRADDVTPEHLLLAIAERDRGVGRVVLEQCGLDLAEAQEQVSELVLPRVERISRPAKPGLDAAALHILAWAREEAAALGHRVLGTEHLVLGILRDSVSPASAFLRTSGVSIENARTQLHTILTAPPRSPLAVVLMDQRLPCRCGMLARTAANPKLPIEFNADTDSYALRLTPSEILVENIFCPFCGGLGGGPNHVLPLCHCGTVDRWAKDPGIPLEKVEMAEIPRIGDSFSFRYRGDDGKQISSMAIYFCPVCGWRVRDKRALEGDR